MSDKIYQSYRQQLNILRSRGMVIGKGSRVMCILERENYYEIKLIGDIQQEITRQMMKRHQVVTHYMTEHGYIPLWVLVNVHNSNTVID